MITADTLARALAPFVGARAGQDPPPFVTSCATEALAMVTRYTEGETIPEEVLTRACIEVGADLYHRRAARNGVAGFEDTDLGQAAIRINRDPMVAARPILAPYMRVGIA